MKKLFTLCFSVTYKKKSKKITSYSNNEKLNKVYDLVKFSLNKSLTSPKQSGIDKILKIAK